MDQIISERRYRKPPIVEALCEIHFADSMWDETIPGSFYEKVKDSFSKKQQREIQQAEITLGPAEATAGVRRLPPWMQFVSDEKHRMIQVAKDLLVVNQLRPYPHFEEWEPEIYNALGKYKALANPKKVVHITFFPLSRKLQDIQHEKPDDVGGESYGEVVQIMRRPSVRATSFSAVVNP